LVIDGGGSGRCIWIENSDVFFKVENCSVYNSYYGISLQYVKNAHLQNINCSSHTFDGISLFYSNSNTISGNTATDIDGYGILLSHSSDNKISDNILYSSIRLDGVNNNVSGNVMKKCGLQIYSGNTVNYYSQNIDTTNLVNGKPLYYYTNEIDLGSNNFTNAGQVILASCRSSFIEDLNLSCGETGITLINCNNNTIKRNTVNNNRNDGIYIFGGDNNTISENTVYYNNNNGFFLEYCDYNLFLENNVSYNTLHGYSCYRLENSIISGNNINHNKEYGINFIYCINNKITGNSLIENEKCFNEDLLSEGNLYENNECVNRAPTISGYNLLLLLSIISLVTIILSKKLKKT
jgi:parallel beta-helix repeat protein